MSGLLIGLKYVSLKDVGLKYVVVPLCTYKQGYRYRNTYSHLRKGFF